MTITDLSKLLFFSSMVIWLFPPFKNYRGKYFWYFVLLAGGDPLSFVIRFIAKENFTTLYYLFVSFLLLMSVFSKEQVIKYKYVWLEAFIVVLSPTLYNVVKYVIVLKGSFLHILSLHQLNMYGVLSYLTIIILHLIIFLVFLKEFIVKYVSEKKFSFFLLFLFAYELTVILKLLNILVGYADATAFFIITSIAQIIFGLIFSIHREDKIGLTI
jgi:hypothetical protein